MNDPCQYVVLHQSLKKYPGAACSQTLHAATEAMTSLPTPPTTKAVILVAETSAEIEALGHELSIAGVHTALIREPDEPYSGAACAIATDVVERHTVRHLFANLKVFR